MITVKVYREQSNDHRIILARHHANFDSITWIDKLDNTGTCEFVMANTVDNWEAIYIDDIVISTFSPRAMIIETKTKTFDDDGKSTIRYTGSDLATVFKRRIMQRPKAEVAGKTEPFGYTDVYSKLLYDVYTHYFNNPYNDYNRNIAALRVPRTEPIVNSKADVNNPQKVYISPDTTVFDLLNQIATITGAVFSVQYQEYNGLSYTWCFLTPRDKTDEVVFSINWGTAISSEVIVDGRGRSNSSYILATSSTGKTRLVLNDRVYTGTNLGRFEVFKDVSDQLRQTDDHPEILDPNDDASFWNYMSTQAFLLTQGKTTKDIDVTASAKAAVYGTDYILGDNVTVSTSDETVVKTVKEVVISVTRANGMTIAPRFGDI